MSGAEAVAGLVLGVLPLLVSAAEHYEDAFRPFARYRKFSQEVQIFQKQFKTQKTIFRNECRLLLTTLTDRDVANQMLDERCHPYWTDPDMDERFARQLGQSGEACVATIALIEKRLADLDRECDGFSNIISNFHKVSQSSAQSSFGCSTMWPTVLPYFQPESPGVKEWRRRVGKKLNFSVSASRLDECIAQLRTLNGDFATLSSQIVRMDEGTRISRRTQGKISDMDGKIGDFQTIRIASQQVYQALGKACTVHTRHSAQLCLEAKRTGSNRTQVRFNMAFTHLALTSSSMPGDPMWFAIESISSDLRTSDPATLHTTFQGFQNKTLLELTKTLKRSDDAASVSGNGKTVKLTKSVRFAISESSTNSAAVPD